MLRKAAGLKNAPNQYVAVLPSPPESTRSRNEQRRMRSCSHSLSGHDEGGAEGPTRVSQLWGTVEVSRDRESSTSWGDSRMTSPVDEGDRALCSSYSTEGNRH